MIPKKREFKAPWKESAQSMHETVTTPSHLSQKWTDMFAFGARSRRVLEDEHGEFKKPSDATGSQQQRIASQLLQSLHEKETSSQRGLRSVSVMDVPTDAILKKFDDVDQKMQTVLDTIKTISEVLDDIKRGQKDTESMNAIIERVSHAVMAFQAHRASDQDCFGETNVENIPLEKQKREVLLKERVRKKFRLENTMLHVSSQESCSSRR